MSYRQCVRALAAALVWLLAAVPAFAQEVQTATISGIIQSADTLPLPGVTVTATSLALPG